MEPSHKTLEKEASANKQQSVYNNLLDPEHIWFQKLQSTVVVQWVKCNEYLFERCSGVRTITRHILSAQGGFFSKLTWVRSALQTEQIVNTENFFKEGYSLVMYPEVMAYLMDCKEHVSEEAIEEAVLNHENFVNVLATAFELLKIVRGYVIAGPDSCLLKTWFDNLLCDGKSEADKAEAQLLSFKDDVCKYFGSDALFKVSGQWHVFGQKQQHAWDKLIEIHNDLQAGNVVSTLDEEFTKTFQEGLPSLLKPCLLNKDGLDIITTYLSLSTKLYRAFLLLKTAQDFRIAKKQNIHNIKEEDQPGSIESSPFNF